MSNIFSTREDARNYLDNLEDENLYKVLLMMSYNLSTIYESTFQQFCRSLKMKVTQIPNLFKTLLKNGIIERADSIFVGYTTLYVLNPMLAPELFIRLSELPEDKLKEIIEISNYSDNDFRLRKNRETLLNYFKDGIIGKLIYTGASFSFHPDYLYLFFRKWRFFPEMHGILINMPFEIINSLFDDVISRYLYYFEYTDFTRLAFFTYENNILPATERKIFSDAVVFCTFLKEADKEAAFQKASLDTPYGLFIHALCKQYEGHYADAIKLYEKGMKLNKSTMPTDLFTLFVYISALMNEGSDKSKNKIIRLSNKKTLDSVTKSIFYLYNSFYTIQDISNLQRISEDKIYELTPLHVILGAIIKSNYGVNLTKTEITELRDCKNKSKLIDIEINRALKISAVASLPSLLPEYIHLEPWEYAIDNILNKYKDEVPVVKDSAKSIRFIYVVDRWSGINVRRQQSKDGIKWSKGRNVAISTYRLCTDEMDELDKKISSFVTLEQQGYYRSDYELRSVDAYKALIGSDKVFREEGNDLIPVSIVEETPSVIFKKTPKGYSFSTNVSLDSNGSYKYFEGNTVLKVVELTTRQLSIIKMIGEIKMFPLNAEDKLKDMISKISKDITVHSDLIEGTDISESVHSDSRITVQLFPKDDGFTAELFVKPFTEEQPYCKAGRGASSVIGKIDGKTVKADRNFKLELRNLVSLKKELIDFNFSDEINDVIDLPSHESCLELLETVKEFDNIARIEWPKGVKIKFTGTISPGDFSFVIKSKVNWFELTGELKIDPELSLSISDIIKRYQQSRYSKFIEIRDGEFALITEDLRKVINTLNAYSTKEKGALKIPEFIAPSLNSFKLDGVKIKGDKEYKDLLDRVEKAEEMEIFVPKQLKADMRDYQETGFRWMVRLSEWGAGACLADDMGLGKTVQTIAMLLYKAKYGPSLIVVPASIIHNWESEIMRFAPSLSVKILNTEIAERKAIVDNASEYDIVITSYGIMNKEVDILTSRRWNVLVLDEAHTIKNKDAKMSKAVMKIDARFRLLLTGTPIQNHLSEIWNLFNVMNPGLLGSFDHFYSNFIVPIEIDKSKSKQEALKKIISPFLLRRTKNEVLNELPGKTEIVMHIDQNKTESLFYESIRSEAFRQLEDKSLSAIQTLAEITKLRQAASNISLVDKSIKTSSSKMLAFLELVDELVSSDHRALVFSQFTSHLALIKDELDKAGIDYLYLDGSTPTLERGKLVKKFQTGDMPLFLISLKAGGVGLNLTAADYVIHLDPWWNPAVEEQASDRSYRIGQTRPVTIYRLITTNTIEEKILELHKTKKNLADALLDGSNVVQKMTKDQLLELLG